MHFKTATLFVLLCMASFTVLAQKVKVTGIVTDSVSTPLVLANVIAVNTTSNEMQAYAISNTEGKYQLSLPANSKYMLRVSYLGFMAQEIPISVGTSDIEKGIVLKAKEYELDALEIVHTMPVTMEGDTIVYKTDAFTNGKEKKLKDVLKKLPGLEVDKEGNVKFQGKKVNKLLVEGKEFFDGDPKLATKNLPANAIDKVEVLRDYNEVQQTQGLGNDQQIALNIKLKEGKKNLVFGDVEVGGGIKEKYFVHPNIFYYSPKTTINFIGDANNIGKQAFTLNDYFRFSGGLKNLMRKGGSSLNLSSDELGISFLRNNKAKNFNSKLGALNFNHSFSKKFNLQGFAIASFNVTDLQTNSLNKYLTAESEQVEVTNSKTNQKNESGLVKLSASYEPNDNLYLDYDVIFKKGKIGELNAITSSIDNAVNDIKTNREKAPFSVEQSFSGYYTANAKNIFSMDIQHLHKKQVPQYNLISSRQPFINQLPLLNESAMFDVSQFKEINTNKFEAALNYYYVLNKKNHLNVTLGNVIHKQNLVSNMKQTLHNGSQYKISGVDYSNDVTYDFVDVFAGLHYKWKIGKFIFNPGLKLHLFNTKNEQLGLLKSRKVTKLLPDVYAKVDIKKSESLTFRYSLNTDFTGIDKIAAGSVITSYNSLFHGNRDLTNDLYQQYSLQYFNFNMFSFTNISAMINYSKKFDDVKSSINYVGNNQEVTPININKADDYLDVRASFERRFGGIKLELKSQVNFANVNNHINSLSSNSKATTQNHKIAVSSNFNDAPNFEIGFSKKINNYTNNEQRHTFYTDKPFANIEWIVFKNFTLVADYEYNNYRSKDKQTKSKYDFLNASLYYQAEGSKFEFKISGHNLLNTKFLSQDYFSEYIITTSQYAVQQRFFMFTVNYNL